MQPSPQARQRNSPRRPGGTTREVFSLVERKVRPDVVSDVTKISKSVTFGVWGQCLKLNLTLRLMYEFGKSLLINLAHDLQAHSNSYFYNAHKVIRN